MLNKTDHTLDLSIAAAEKDGKPYLGDQAVVRDLVGDLGSEALSRLVKFSSGEIDQEAVSAADVAEATALAKVFLGQNDEYNVVQGWNEPGKIDDFVAAQANIGETDPVQRLATLFILVIQDMYAAARLLDDGEGEDTARAAIDGSLDSAAALLMGIPYHEYEATGLDDESEADPEA